MFPQTPARVQLSLWPGGLASNAQGTIDWAGGQINWNGPDIQTNGYYYAMFQSVEVSCYNATSAPGTNTEVSYTYNNAAGTNNTVVDGNSPTVLKSLLGTGDDMDAGDPASSSSASGTASSKSSATPVAQVPGLSGAGTGSDNHAGDTSSASAPANSPTASTAESSSPSPTAASNGQFSQGGQSSSTTKSGADKLGSQEKALKGSLFAGVVVLVAMMAT
jgi:hypothetical protein